MPDPIKATGSMGFTLAAQPLLLGPAFGESAERPPRALQGGELEAAGRLVERVRHGAMNWLRLMVMLQSRLVAMVSTQASSTPIRGHVFPCVRARPVQACR